MSDGGLPVSVEVTRPDGSVERVRVGTAHRNGDGFILRLGELSIGAAPAERGAAAPAQRRSAPAGGGGAEAVFPPYGRSKGMPIRGASQQDLEFYASGARRSLNDPSKSRWHDKERALLAAIEAEMARQGLGGGGGGGESEEPPFPSEEDIPF